MEVFATFCVRSHQAGSTSTANTSCSSGEMISLDLRKSSWEIPSGISQTLNPHGRCKTGVASGNLSIMLNCVVLLLQFLEHLEDACSFDNAKKDEMRDFAAAGNLWNPRNLKQSAAVAGV